MKFKVSTNLSNGSSVFMDEMWPNSMDKWCLEALTPYPVPNKKYSTPLMIN